MYQKDVLIKLMKIANENFSVNTFTIIYTVFISFFSSLVTYLCLGKEKADDNGENEDDDNVRFLALEKDVSSLSAVVQKNKKQIKQNKFKLDMQESEQDKFSNTLKEVKEDVSNIEDYIAEYIEKTK